MTSKDLTALILTYNEAPNIERTLQKLTWLERIIVIDSYSSDGTLEILKNFRQVKLYQRNFDSFASQCNFGLQQITTDWVLSIDADYVLSDDLIAELLNLEPQDLLNAFNIRFKYCIFGKPLRGTLYPPRKVLFRREKATYENDGHAHFLKVEGGVGLLSSFILHDDRKPLSRWLSSQDRYMLQEVEKLRQTTGRQLSLSDRIRKNKILSPLIVLIYCLFVKKGVLDGWRGWYYALQRVLAETLLAIRLIEDEILITDSADPGCYQRPAENSENHGPARLTNSK